MKLNRIYIIDISMIEHMGYEDIENDNIESEHSTVWPIWARS